jgi:hypothetical protein
MQIARLEYTQVLAVGRLAANIFRSLGTMGSASTETTDYVKRLSSATSALEMTAAVVVDTMCVETRAIRWACAAVARVVVHSTPVDKFARGSRIPSIQGLCPPAATCQTPNPRLLATTGDIMQREVI